MAKNPEKTNDTKDLFMKCGTCSHTFGHLLDREFGNLNSNEEAALDPLAGGIMNHGHQCGMLWGTALAVGRESYRRQPDTDRAIPVAVTATQGLVDSFVKRTDTVNCREIVDTDLNTVTGMVGFMLKTVIGGMKNSQCFNLAEEWAPEAIEAAKVGLVDVSIKLVEKPVSCSSIVAKRLGATEEEMVAVAGYAGGLGLSGNTCGALSAAIWMKTLQWCKENPGKSPPYFTNKAAKKLLRAFKEETDSETLCSKITGRKFLDINDHSEFINRGGCSKLINVLSSVD